MFRLRECHVRPTQLEDDERFRALSIEVKKKKKKKKREKYVASKLVLHHVNESFCFKLLHINRLEVKHEERPHKICSNIRLQLRKRAVIMQCWEKQLPQKLHSLKVDKVFSPFRALILNFYEFLAYRSFRRSRLRKKKKKKENSFAIIHVRAISFIP